MCREVYAALQRNSRPGHALGTRAATGLLRAAPEKDHAVNQIRSRLADLVRQQQARMSGGTSPAAGDGDLIELTDFGANPGALRMLAHAPQDLPAGAPLVVALHGCTQTAGGYDRGTGWSALAAAGGFALLLPEQRQANNPNRCFNWFEPGDTTRGLGEVRSIHAAVEHLIATRGIDPARVFVTGLSAGGAMASSLLATYPEMFAAGAIIAGLPHGAATSMPEAFQAMSTGKPRAAADWAALVRSASRHDGPWPRVSIWQGDADTTVRPANAEQLIRQWGALHGTTGAPEQSGSGTRRTQLWRGADGRVVLEHHAIAGMAHGVPLDAAGGGEAGPFFLSVGVASTIEIAEFFGLPAEQPAGRPATERPAAPSPGAGTGATAGRTIDQDGTPVSDAQTDDGFSLGGVRLSSIDPSGVIRKALTTAGLIKG
jgi:feruloyl esterase